MAVVRYIALAALVVWLGAMQSALVGNRATDVGSLAYACGGVLVVGLFTMKFLGPPPKAFAIRVAIVVVMLALTLVDRRWDSSTPTLINTALGFVLLAWYAHE